MAKTVSLTDAVQLSKEFNLRKQPPYKQQIDQLKPEDYVRLRANGEYFWVKVDEVTISEVSSFVGIILETPVFKQKFEKNDKINFTQNNVFDIASWRWLNNELI
jgi:hypothetical protein